MSQRRVFISYSRKDGAEVAQALRDGLRAAGCEVWLDTDRIEGGVSWSKEVEKALSDCQVVIPVLGAAEAPRPLHLSTLNYRRWPAQEVELLADVDAQGDAAATEVVALR